MPPGSKSNVVNNNKRSSSNKTPHHGSGSRASSNGAAGQLQERLHELITRLVGTIEQIKNWPEASGDDASIHVESTTLLIASIRAIMHAKNRVEQMLLQQPSTSTTDATLLLQQQQLHQQLQSCPIPLDLLDLMDHGGGGLNPECFCRGLLREAQAQLAVLKRRKIALERLGDLVQAGIVDDEQDELANKEEEEETEKSRVNQEESLDNNAQLLDVDDEVVILGPKRNRKDDAVKTTKDTFDLTLSPSDDDVEVRPTKRLNSNV